MRFAKRVDDNHTEIMRGLRKCGYRVRDYSGCGQGVPDLAVMIAPGESLFLEVKNPAVPPSDRKLSKAEEEWVTYFGSITYTVLTVEGALAAIADYREKRGWTQKSSP